MMGQPRSSDINYSFRTLNYLGSKLRLLDFIEEQVCRLTPANAGVCDLFAGSGTVSYRLSSRFPIVSCDIQCYSKVICDALLQKHHLYEEQIQTFFFNLNQPINDRLLKAFAPLITLEEKAIHDRDLEVLATIIERGSTEVFRLEHADTPLSASQQQVMDNLAKNGIEPQSSIMSRYYGGVYFSYRQAVILDLIVSAIHSTFHEDDRSIALAALLSTASDIVDTVGKHFAQPIKVRDSKGVIKPLVYNKAMKDKTIDVLGLYKKWFLKYLFLAHSDFRHLSMQGDFSDCLSNLPNYVRTVYADPPYTRDHYSRFYHVLETIALGDMPEVSTVKKNGQTTISNGIYRKVRHQSPFCIKSSAPKAFNEMFHSVAMSNRSLVLSYSPYDRAQKTHPRVVTMDQLVLWAKDYFSHVKIQSAGHFTHNKLNSKEHQLQSSDEAEVLIICTN